MCTIIDRQDIAYNAEQLFTLYISSPGCASTPCIGSTHLLIITSMSKQ